MTRLVTIACCALLVLGVAAFHEVSATPSRNQTCSNCHSLDSAVTVTVTLLRCTGTDAEYEVTVSNTYAAAEGWAVFDSGANVRNDYGTSGIFTVPASATYEVYGVSHGSGFGGSNVETITPDCGPTCTDSDLDTYYAEDGCGTQVDCNDGDMAINPGVMEDCTDGIDNDCDGLVDSADPDAVNCPPGCTDLDSDGYNVDGGTCGAVDCNDQNASVNPGANENCVDGIDNDCDGLVDMADPDAINCPPTCTDADSDGYNVDGGACGAMDCDDTDPQVRPGATEDCTNGIDDDCDSLIDSADTDCGGCVPTRVPERGRWCGDGYDNDCDGLTDDADPDCRNNPQRREICDDGIDNDGDQLIDCDDRRSCARSHHCRPAAGRRGDDD